MVDDLTGDYLKSNRCIYSLDFDRMCGKKASIYLLHVFNSYGKTASKKVYLCSCSEHAKSFRRDVYNEVSKEEYFNQFEQTEFVEPELVETNEISLEKPTKIEPKNEWEEFIWSKPMNLLAKELNVSIPTLRKRCVQIGINTPPVGFWSKKS